MYTKILIIHFLSDPVLSHLIDCNLSLSGFVCISIRHVPSFLYYYCQRTKFVCILHFGIPRLCFLDVIMLHYLSVNSLYIFYLNLCFMRNLNVSLAHKGCFYILMWCSNMTMFQYIAYTICKNKVGLCR